ncbi:MAG: LamG-like jellyroll fold domain-containing protein, partial [Candidatus Omnitrophota bacterium]
DSDTINVASTVTLTNLDTFTTTGSTFIFDGTTTLTSAGLAFNAIQLGTGAVGASLTAADNMDINGNVTILNGGATTWNVTSRTINAAGSVTLTNLDTFTVTGSTFVFDGTTSLTSAGYAFNNIQLGSGSAGGSLTPVDNMDINGNVTVMNGGATTWNIANRMIKVAGSFTLTNLDTFTTTGSMVIFDGSSSETITSAGFTFNHFMINDGLIAYWKFDETSANSCTGGVNDACDSSGNNRDGSWNGAPTGSTTVADVNFINDRSLDFSGSGDYVDAAIPTLSNYTYSAWFYTRSFNNGGTNDGSGTYFVDRQVSGNPLVSLKAIGGNFAYQRRADNGTGLGALSGAAIQLNTWQHIAWGRDSGTEFFIFVNGVKFSAGDALGALTPDNPRIGSHQALGGPGFFNGLMDDFRIYNRVLSTMEIQALASGNQPGTAIGVYTLQDNLDVNGTLTLQAGELDAGANRTIALAGNWQNNGGIFDPQSGQVTLDGTNQLINSSQTFYNLSKVLTGSPSRTLTFGQQSTITMENILDLQGFGVSDRLNIRSSSVGTRFTFNLTAGTQSTQYLDVQDSQASGYDIRAKNSLNSGNTDTLEASPRWIFGPLRGAVLIID